LKAERHELVVPAVSVEETVNKFAARLAELLKSARQAERALRALLAMGDYFCGRQTKNKKLLGIAYFSAPTLRRWEPA
jgi:hypothetical protein